jgi:hypothetical protein
MLNYHRMRCCGLRISLFRCDGADANAQSSPRRPKLCHRVEIKACQCVRGLAQRRDETPLRLQLAACGGGALGPDVTGSRRRGREIMPGLFGSIKETFEVTGRVVLRLDGEQFIQVSTANSIE